MSKYDGIHDPRHIADLRADAERRRRAAESHPRARRDPAWREAVLEAAALAEAYADRLERDANPPESDADRPELHTDSFGQADQ